MEALCAWLRAAAFAWVCGRIIKIAYLDPSGWSLGTLFWRLVALPMVIVTAYYMAQNIGQFLSHLYAI